MKNETLIAVSELAMRLGVETSLIFTLEERGLIKTMHIEQEVYIEFIELPRLEKILRLHDDLDINLEGIETITHLLERIGNLQDEIASLENKLRLYE